MLFNLAFSIAVKALQAILGFAIIHHLISSWGQAKYGTWVTMTSLIAYTTMFDFGVGYGVKNNISEAHALGRLADAESHAIFGILFYGGASCVIFIAGMIWIPNVSPFRENMLASNILWIGFVFSFFLSYANIVLQALGRFRISNGVALFVPLVWFICVVIFSGDDSMSLQVAAATYAALLVVQGAILATAVSRLWGFKLRGRFIESTRLARSLLLTGAKFFILQVSSLALFYSGTMMAFQFLGPVEVARYDAANKVFSMFSIGFSIFISIAWTEISRAKSAGNPARLKRIFLLLNAAALLVFAAATTVAYFSPSIVSRLTNVSLPSSDAFPFAVLIGLQAFAFSSAVYLNAFEKLMGQVVLALVSIPLFFGAAAWLLTHGHGIGSIPLAAVVATLPATLFCFSIARGLIGSVGNPVLKAG